VSTARERLLFHYIPLAVFSLYAPILYFYLIILCPCQRVYNTLKHLCDVVCFRSIVPIWFNWFEVLANYIIPMLLTVAFSIGLIARAIVQKNRLQQTAGWHRHRKMIIQLILTCSIYLIFDLPYMIIMIVQWSRIPSFVSDIISPYIIYLTYVPAIVLPYAILMLLPDLKKKFRALIICKVNQRQARNQIFFRGGHRQRKRYSSTFKG
jgi:hypothetical protein